MRVFRNQISGALKEHVFDLTLNSLPQCVLYHGKRIDFLERLLAIHKHDKVRSHICQTPAPPVFTVLACSKFQNYHSSFVTSTPHL